MENDLGKLLNNLREAIRRSDVDAINIACIKVLNVKNISDDDLERYYLEFDEHYKKIKDLIIFPIPAGNWYYEGPEKIKNLLRLKEEEAANQLLAGRNKDYLEIVLKYFKNIKDSYYAKASKKIKFKYCSSRDKYISENPSMLYSEWILKICKPNYADTYYISLQPDIHYLELDSYGSAYDCLFKSFYEDKIEEKNIPSKLVEVLEQYKSFLKEKQKQFRSIVLIEE